MNFKVDASFSMWQFVRPGCRHDIVPSLNTLETIVSMVICIWNNVSHIIIKLLALHSRGLVAIAPVLFLRIPSMARPAMSCMLCNRSRRKHPGQSVLGRMISYLLEEELHTMSVCELISF